MNRINLLYLSIPVMVLGLFWMFRQINQRMAGFYGFAENKETEINLDHAVTVNRVYVKPGQFVRKGDLLLEVTRIALDLKMNELGGDIAGLQAENRWRETELRASIRMLEAEREEAAGIIRNQLRLLESERALNRQLFRNLKSVHVPDTAQTGPVDVRIAALQQEINLVVEPYNREIARLEQALQLESVPAQTQIAKLRRDVDLFKTEQQRTKMYAPSDGLCGYVHCKEGENIPAFTALISFYEQHPNMVIGYVHESQSLQINVGDSLRVVSSLRPEEQRIGQVSGLGHRIVEIPARLRKIPEILTYGREVLIDISGDNNFLQKEKVQLQWME